MYLCDGDVDGGGGCGSVGPDGIWELAVLPLNLAANLNLL